MKSLKPSVIFLLAAGLAYSSWAQGALSIQGTLLNNRFHNVQLMSIVRNDPTVFMESPVNPEGGFTLSGSIPQADIYRLSFSDKDYLLCSLQPGDQLTLTLDAGNLSEIIATTGSPSMELTKKLSDTYQNRKRILDSLNRSLQENREQIYFNQIHQAFVPFQQSNKEIDLAVMNGLSDARALIHAVDQYTEQGKARKGKEDSLLFSANEAMKSLTSNYGKFTSYMLNIRPTYNFPPPLDAKEADYNQYIDQYMDVLDERHTLLIQQMDPVYTRISRLLEERNALVGSGKMESKKIRDKFISELSGAVDSCREEVVKTEGEYMVKAQASENLSQEILDGAQTRVSAIVQEYQAAFDRENKEVDTEIIDLIQKHKDDLSVLMFIDLFPAEQYPDLHRSVAEALHTKYPGNSLVESKYKQMTSQAPPTSVGALAPELAFPNPQGKIMKLSDLRGKYVLIDFWASWCGPCRKENPNVVAMYNKYKEKGFEIYSVSLDRSKEAWVKAIEADHLIWPNHVSDLKYWSSEGAKLYGVGSIPATFLIDKEGRIIAKNLRGAALSQMLHQIFGE